jgi:predicted ribosome quality control (RQC) complex YloA/Tae2 family protein
VGEDRQDRRDEVGRPASRVSVQDAAEVLGTTVDAIRKRVQRGTISYDKDADGRVWILLDTDMLRQDASQDTTGQRHDTRDVAPLVEEMRGRIESLERQLEQANERDRENRRIIAALTSRIPAIEAPQEATEAPSEATPQPGRVEPQPAVESKQAQEAPETVSEAPRRWWEFWR